MTSNNGLGLSEGNNIIGLGIAEGTQVGSTVLVSFSTSESTSESSSSIKHNLVAKKSIGGEPKLLILNNSISRSRSGMPLKDLTGDNTSYFSMDRKKYVRTKDNLINNTNSSSIKQQKKWYGSNNNSAISINNYYKRRVNFPSSVFNIDQKTMSHTNNYDVNYVQRSVRQRRSGGSIVPLKITKKNIS